MIGMNMMIGMNAFFGAMSALILMMMQIVPTVKKNPTLIIKY